MIRKSVFWTLLDLVFLIAFNLIFFIVSGLTHTISVWISYTFIHISYVMVFLLIFSSAFANSTLDLIPSLFSKTIKTPLVYCSALF